MATSNNDPSREKYYEELLHNLNIFFHDLNRDLSFIRALAGNVKHLKKNGKLSDIELDRLLDEIEEKTESASTRIRDLMSNRRR